MLMQPTALIYSSHNRCDYLHRQWIVERALQSPDNKTILYLPFSMGRRDQQDYSWGTFRWYFDQFSQWGLRADTFFWNEHLSRVDAEIFFDMLESSEVVILGGGNAQLGFDRYGGMGGQFFGDWEMFNKILHQRQAEEKLTVGFSAGAIQLGDASLFEDGGRCYGLIHNIAATLHHEWGAEDELRVTASEHPTTLIFGLPNDSGIASNQGFLPSGNKWQALQFIVDNSWTLPADGFHIKTRQGMKIDHFYHDGRRWTFDGGDVLVRVISPDYSYQGTWILQPNTPVIYDYWTQTPTGYQSLEHILVSH